MHPNLGAMFPGLTQHGGKAYITPTGARPLAAAPVPGSKRGLAGEADVMMISGLNGAPRANLDMYNQMQPNGMAGFAAAPAGLMEQLKVPVTLGAITLPLWQWLLLALAAGGAAGYYMGRR